MRGRGVVDLDWIALSLLAQARTLAGQVALLDAHVELLIDRLADDQTATADVAVESLVRCDHPDDVRMDAGSLRAPLRFFCKSCRRFVDPASPSDPASGTRSLVDVPS